eukprot:GFKZ01004559.1.p1 GENE.GFKZ01004559.1~~GFKZ01004559.1.p1  ORF type:complete len:318 (+),score=49.14 GFKZ01004559.1:112-1065(+)
MTNPNVIPPSTAQVRALNKHLTAVRKQLTATEAQVAVLREDNNRLEAALAVERAAREPDALRKAQHDLHLVKYKLLRVLKIFDCLHLQRPDVNVRPGDFVTDEFLADFCKRVEAHFEQKLNREECHGEPRPASAAPESRKPAGVVGVDHVVAPASDSRSIPGGDYTPQPGQSDPRAKPVPSPRKGSPVLIDASNPAAEIMRLLIGASSVEVHQSPPEVRIQMANEEGTRDAAFFLSLRDGVLTASREFIKFDGPQLPVHLAETPMEFDVHEAPNFLIALMGAIFDFTVQPGRKQTDFDNIPSPTQRLFPDENSSMEV